MKSDYEDKSWISKNWMILRIIYQSIAVDLCHLDGVYSFKRTRNPETELILNKCYHLSGENTM